MSSRIRTKLGGAKGRLKDQLTKRTLSPLPLVKTELSLEENIRVLHEIKNEALLENEKLGRKTNFLKDLLDEWERYLYELDDDQEFKDEKQRYENQTQGEQGYYHLLYQGEDRIDELTTWLKQIDTTLKELILQQALAPDSNDINVQASESRREFRGQREISVRLPTLNLPYFDGNVLKFSEFWDAFETSVHNHPDLSPVQKINYLKGQLKGKAADAIANLPSSSANYSVAITILKDRFGRKEVIVEHLYDELRNLPFAKSGKSFDLRAFSDKVEATLRQLEAQGEEIDNQCTVGLILERLPKGVSLRLHEQYKTVGSQWDVPTLRQAIETLVQTHEKVFGTVNIEKSLSASGGKQEKVVGFKPKHDSSKGTMFMMQKGTSESTKRCLLCGEDHYSDQCKKYATLEARKRRLFELKRCFKCMKLNCFSKTCSAPKKECTHCKELGKHCRTLCPKQFGHVTPIAMAVSQPMEMSAKTDSQATKTLPHITSNAQCMVAVDQIQLRADASMNVFCSDQAQVKSVDTQRAQQSYDEKASAIDNQTLLTVEKPVRKVLQNNATKNPEYSIVAKDTSHGEVNDKKVVSSLDITKNETQLMTLRSKLSNPETGREIQIRIFFDSGSHFSFISSKTAKLLKLKPLYQTKLSLKTFGNQSYDCDSSLVECRISSLDGTNDKSMLIQAYTSDNLAGLMVKQPLSSEDKRFLKEIKCEVPSKGEIFKVELIIGADYFWTMIESPKIRMPSGLHLIRTTLGPIVTGSTEKKVSNNRRIVGAYMTKVDSIQFEKDANELANSTEISAQAATDVDFVKFWSLESIGITDSPNVNDKDMALASFNSTIKFKNCRYIVSWPWKKGTENLANNYQLALKRLKQLFKRFKASPELFSMYDKIIQDQVKLGIIEPIDREQIDGYVHYIPHHPVLTPTKSTTKVRIVYDASAKASKTENSLNESLYSGPNLIPDICGLLLRFRLGEIALTADIEKAFLQIGLRVEDRDVTRFLWLKDTTKFTTEDNIEIFRFCRIAFGIISSPFLLNATLQFHLKSDDSKAANLLAQNIYVDNLLLSTDTAKQAVEIYEKARELFMQANFNLREWATNCEHLRTQIVSELRAQTNQIQTLGIHWNVEKDTFVLNFPHNLNCIYDTTKRGVLKGLASLYDPLGLFAPVTLLGKLLIKSLWDDKMNWDDIIGNAHYKEWCKVRESLEQIPNYEIKRYVRHNPRAESAKNMLLIFVDASTKAYAAAAYLRTENSQIEEPKVNLIFAKTRIATKELTLPRLELMAILIGVRIIKFLRNQLDIKICQTNLFSDSMIALGWITTTKPLGVFISNRVKEIQSEKDIEFRFVQSTDNPADCASRGLYVQQLINHTPWWHGPKWITKPLDDWPNTVMPIKTNVPNELLINIMKSNDLNAFKLELRKGKTVVNTVTTFVPLIDISKYSKLSTPINIMSYVLKYLHIQVWKKLSLDVQQNQMYGLGDIIRVNETLALRRKARRVLIRVTQQQAFTSMYEHLIECHTKFMSPDKKSLGRYAELCPSLDDHGIVRVHSRLAEMTSDQGYPRWMPILLPPEAVFTKLLIEQTHRDHLHAGVQQTLASVRLNGFWVPTGRQMVKKILKRCVACKKVQGAPYQLPKMADLPKERVEKSLAFLNVGLDYFGPIMVKTTITDNLKVWVCLFTCLATRAIHLEVVYNMSAVSFLNCFRRFTARRGQPISIVSDNAPHFKVVQKTLVKTLELSTNEMVTDYLQQKEIKWVFITEYSPWEGGIYERMVGLAKKSIKKVIGARRLEIDQLHTFICEVEATLNTRPLTVVTEELNERCLRPIDLVQHNTNIVGPVFESEDQSDPEYVPKKLNSVEQLLSYWKKSQVILNNYWTDWHQHYLLCLQERKQRYHKGPRVTVKTVPQIGEVVLVLQQNQPHINWKMAVIIAVQFGRDKEIRSAQIRFANGAVARRPVNHLVPLEVRTVSEEDELQNQKIQSFMITAEGYEMPKSAKGDAAETSFSNQDFPPPPMVAPPAIPQKPRMKLDLPVKLCNSAACLPSRATMNSAGFDLYSSQRKMIGPGEWESVETGINVKIQEGYFGLITARSGLAANSGVTTLCGVIDNDYTGPIKVVLQNHSKKALQIELQQRIAQLLIIPYFQGKVLRVNSLPATERQTSGFGSSGETPQLVELPSPKIPCWKKMMRVLFVCGTGTTYIILVGSVLWLIYIVNRIPVAGAMTLSLSTGLGRNIKLPPFLRKPNPERGLRLIENMCRQGKNSTVAISTRLKKRCEAVKRFKQLTVELKQGKHPELFELYKEESLVDRFLNFFDLTHISDSITIALQTVKDLFYWIVVAIVIITGIIFFGTLIRITIPTCKCCWKTCACWCNWLCKPFTKPKTKSSRVRYRNNNNDQEEIEMEACEEPFEPRL